ncbi:hypothetical protein NPIL_625091, partial [Nephila pilipes]
ATMWTPQLDNKHEMTSFIEIRVHEVETLNQFRALGVIAISALRQKAARQRKVDPCPRTLSLEQCVKDLVGDDTSLPL